MHPTCTFTGTLRLALHPAAGYCKLAMTTQKISSHLLGKVFCGFVFRSMGSLEKLRHCNEDSGLGKSWLSTSREGTETGEGGRGS